jgi:hypothetical protein
MRYKPEDLADAINLICNQDGSKIDANDEKNAAELGENYEDEEDRLSLALGLDVNSKRGSSKIEETK